MEATEIPTTTAADLWLGAQILVTVRGSLVAAFVRSVDLIEGSSSCSGPVSKGSTTVGYVEVHLSGGEQVALRPLSKVTVIDGMIDLR